MTRSLFLLAALSLACKDASPLDSAAPDGDRDGDGLQDSFEARIGADPDAADSDGDGCDDAVEVLTGYDPLDAADHPGDRGYPRGPRPTDAHFAALADAHGEGWAVDQLNPNWSLTDQHGQPVELYDYFGQVVLIDIATEWCAPCQRAAGETQSLFEAHADEGFVVLQILVEGVVNDGLPDTARWAEAFGLSYPVLEDYSPGDRFVTEVAQYYIDTPTASYDIPNFSVLDRQLRVASVYEVLDPDLALVQALLDTPLPESDAPMPENEAALREALGLEAGHFMHGPEVCD
ncbi:MAG: TlpA family protein disulfide reductase [Alphaproteobacteria bacterium]|nr:TlpA family protein disulfide reductase [Alphaproteobacteria bacterium]MCB9793597.1 TlpA family protein disulfide reductase [Alphaproteobacteria bacterium]